MNSNWVLVVRANEMNASPRSSRPLPEAITG
jgi:hypothetical protein